jgi:hypothetical protein
MEELQKYGVGNQPATIKIDSRPVYMEHLNHLVKSINRVAGNLKNEIFPNTLQQTYDNIVSNNNVLEERIPPRLLPQHAYTEVPYGEGNDKLTIYAVTPTSSGNDTLVVFVDPEMGVFNNIDVSYNITTKTVTILHATDENGDISTLAGNLVTAINTNETVGLIIQAAVQGAGTIDFVGTVQLEGWVSGIVCKKNYLFATDTSLILAVKECNGIDNEVGDFRHISFNS